MATDAEFGEYLLVTMAQRISSDPAAPYTVGNQKTQLCVSDVVLLKADAHRNAWPDGRVIGTLPSTDGRV